MLEDEARRPRDRRAEKKRAEALITIVFCAKGVSGQGGAGRGEARVGCIILGCQPHHLSRR